jgi:DNA-binding transcriptional ArsR family regulator
MTTTITRPTNRPLPDDYTPPRAPSLFRGEQRTRLLLLIAVLGETYPAELARYSGSSISSVQLTLDVLEEEGLISTRQLVVRAVTLNPTYPAAKELKALLLRVAEGYPAYREIAESIRRRPRRRQKRL